MAKKYKRPSAKEIEKLVGILTERNQQRNTDIEYRRELLWRRRQVTFGHDRKNNPQGIPEMYRFTTIENRSPILQYNAQEAVALLSSNAPTTAIRVARTEAQNMATLCERWCNGSRSRLEETTHAGAADWFTVVALFATVRKVYPREKRWPGYPLEPGKDGEGQPLRDAEGNIKKETDEEYNERTEKFKKVQHITSVFQSTHVPIETVYWLPPDGGKGLPVVVEVKKVNEKELMAEFGLTRTGEGDYLKSQAGIPADIDDDPLQKTEVVEYWNRRCRIIYVRHGDKLKEIDVWEHGLGRTPYFIAPAYETGELAEELQYIPLLWPLYPEVEENNRLHTMRTNIFHFTAFPKWYIYTAATGQMVLDEKTGEPKVFDLHGPPNQLEPGQEIRQVVLQSSIDFQAALKDSDDRLKTFALPPVASGKAPSSESAGWNTAMLRRFMVSLLDPLVQGRANQEAEIDRFKLWCIKNVIGEKVYVNEDPPKKGKAGEVIAIGPDEVEKLGDFDLVVRIDPNLQLDRIPQEQHGWTLVKEEGRSMLQWLEQDCGNEAPEEEMERIDTEKTANVMWEQMVMPRIQAWVDALNPVEGVLGGGSAEEIMRQDQATEAGLGKGSPGQPRAPGVRMPASMPIGESPTYTPSETA